MDYIVISLAVLGGLGLVFGLGLAIASKKLAIKTDDRVEQIRELLPGANCGGCGFPGCDGFAAALAAGESKPDGCAVCSAGNLKEIGSILGLTIKKGKPKAARVICQGDRNIAVYKAEYEGLKDCKAAKLVSGGNKACAYGCLGFGTCENVCKFGAIKINEDNIAVVDPDLCTACGTCAANCPQSVIKIMNKDAHVLVACSNPEFGKKVSVVCKKGCIGCAMCFKACRYEAIEMDGRLPVIDYKKCTGCGECVAACKFGSMIKIS